MIDRDRRRLFKNKWFNRNKLLQVKLIFSSEPQGKPQYKRHSHSTVKCFNLLWWEMCLLSRPFSPSSSPEMLQADAFPFCVKNTFLLRAWWQPTQCGWPEDLEAALQSVPEFSWTALSFTYASLRKTGRAVIFLKNYINGKIIFEIQENKQLSKLLPKSKWLLAVTLQHSQTRPGHYEGKKWSIVRKRTELFGWSIMLFLTETKWPTTTSEKICHCDENLSFGGFFSLQ